MHIIPKCPQWSNKGEHNWKKTDSRNGYLWSVTYNFLNLYFSQLLVSILCVPTERYIYASIESCYNFFFLACTAISTFVNLRLVLIIKFIKKFISINAWRALRTLRWICFFPSDKNHSSKSSIHSYRINTGFHGKSRSPISKYETKLLNFYSISQAALLKNIFFTLVCSS